MPHSEDRMERLAALADAHSGGRSDRALEGITRAACDLLPADVGSTILVWDESSLAFSDPHGSPPATGLPTDSGPADRVRQEGVPLYVASPADDPFGWAGAATVAAYSCHPLASGDTFLGALLTFSSTPRNFDADDRSFLTVLAGIAASALATQALITSAAEGRHRADALASAGRRLLTATSLIDVGSVLIQAILQTVPGCAAMLLADTLDEEDPEILVSYGQPTAAALRAGLDCIAAAEILSPGGTSIAVPVPLDERLDGALVVERDDALPYNREHIDLAKLLGTHAAMATANLELIAEIARLARTDHLTGIANRLQFQQFGDSVVAAASGEGRAVAVAMADIDHFKSVNDEFGHLVGDQVIEQVADRIRNEVRDSDLVARYGGEEFVVVMPGSTESGAALAAERMRASVADEPFITTAGALRVTISLGVAEMTDPAWNLEVLCDSADMALLAAKREGRNRVIGASTLESVDAES